MNSAGLTSAAATKEKFKAKYHDSLLAYAPSAILPGLSAEL